MDEGYQGQEILGVGLGHRPVDARFVGGRIAEHAEDAFDEIGEAALFATLAHRAARIDRQHRRIAAQHAVHQRSPIIGQTRHDAHLVGDAFHRFLDRMEIVVGQQFRAAEAQHIGMDASRLQIGAQFFRAALCFRQRRRLFDGFDLSRLAHYEAGESQRLVETGTHRLVAMRLAAIAGWSHRMADKAEDARAVLPCVLAGGESVVDAVPLGNLAGIGHLTGREQHRDLRPLEPRVRVAECAGDGFKLILRKQLRHLFLLPLANLRGLLGRIGNHLGT